MFLVSDQSSTREQRILEFLETECAIAVILSAVHFEWTVRRAIIALGSSPNVEIRKDLKSCHGPEKYKLLWKKEIHVPKNQLPLTKVVKNWEDLSKAFKLRHRIVHGVSSCGSEYAEPHVTSFLSAAKDIREFCKQHQVDLYVRLPVRRKKYSQT
ncbi:MAG: hypothetical protein HC790_01255 [Acaryochloridaceae cyanobacterium CSU_3_4]|nr:hypothetical protein [Acaryochloris sp. SU_5_25]NJN37646.1 hypothetical protein [Acaryochloridaceae cyanobacterium CSU_3_4]